MARLSQPARSAFTDPADLDAYDAVTRRAEATGMTTPQGPEEGVPGVNEYWSAMLNSPRMCAINSQMSTFVRTAGDGPGTYSHADREFVDQVLSADWKTNVVQVMHLPDAVAAGVRLAAIEALRSGHEEDLTDDELLLATFIRQVLAGTVEDETFARMEARLGPRGIVEYAGFILWLARTIRLMQLFDVEDPPDEEIDALVTGLRDGSVAIPDFRERLG